MSSAAPRPMSRTVRRMRAGVAAGAPMAGHPVAEHSPAGAGGTGIAGPASRGRAAHRSTMRPPRRRFDCRPWTCPIPGTWPPRRPVHPFARSLGGRRRTCASSAPDSPGSPLRCTSPSRVLGGRAGGCAGRVGGERTQRRAGRQRDAGVDSRAGTVPRPGTRRDPLGAVRGGEGDHRGPHRPSRHRMRLAAGQPARVPPASATWDGSSARRSSATGASAIAATDAVPRGDARGGRERGLCRGTDGRGRRTPASARFVLGMAGPAGAGRRPDLRGLTGRTGAMGRTRAGVHGGRSRRSGLRRPCRQRVPGSP